MLVLHDARCVIYAALENPAGFDLRGFLRQQDESGQTHFWIWDGAGGNAWRREFYPKYKETRKTPRSAISQGFEYFYEILKTTNAVQFRVKGYEADDIIAWFAAQGPCHVDTRDYDLRALVGIYPGVTCAVRPKDGIPDDRIQLYKMWVGDPSDNIAGVAGFGRKSWDSADHADLHALTFDDEDRLEVEDLPGLDDKWIPRWRLQSLETREALRKVVLFRPGITETLVMKGMCVGVQDIKKREAELEKVFL